MGTREAVELGDGWVFLTASSGYDAFGQRRVAGALFDTVAGTVQPGAVATGPGWCTDRDVLIGAARAKGIGR